MPQLDPGSYASQVFWLVVTFVILYLLLWKVALPRVSAVLRERQERIDGDLEKAQRLRAEASEVLSAYDAAIAEGRAKAQTALREAGERMAREAADRQAAAMARIKEETEAAERRIEAAKREALDNVRQIAAGAARDAASKLMGAEVSDREAEDAAAHAIRERG